MPKYVVLSGKDLESKLRYGDLEAAKAKAHHEVRERGGGPLYVAQIISAFDAEFTVGEVPIGEEPEASSSK